MARSSLYSPARVLPERHCPLCMPKPEGNWHKLEILKEKGLCNPHAEYRFIFHGKNRALRLDLAFRVLDFATRNSVKIELTSEPSQWDLSLLNRLVVLGASVITCRTEDIHAIAPGQHVTFYHACCDMHSRTAWESPLPLAHIAMRPRT